MTSRIAESASLIRMLLQLERIRVRVEALRGRLVVEFSPLAAAAILLLLPEVPERADDLRSRDVVRVVGDEAEEEGAVLSEVFVVEASDESSFASDDAAAEDEVVTNKSHAVAGGERTDQPNEEAKDADGGHEDHPEPQKYVDLFVVEISEIIVSSVIVQPPWF